MKTATLVPIEPHEMHRISGGGFAYDVGRVLRFLGIAGSGSNPCMVAWAVTDWQVNKLINEQENNPE